MPFIVKEHTSGIDAVFSSLCLKEGSFFMLKTLTVWNFALLEHVQVEFGSGLNILTGETGAGKSILIDSLGAILGARMSADFIRTGCDWLRVEAVFTLDDESLGLHELLTAQAIDDSEGELIITRQLGRNGRSNVLVNGCHVTLAVLKAIGAYLVDIHGQNENLALLKEESQFSLLDHYDADLAEALAAYRHVYEEWRACCRQYAEKEQAAREYAQRLDMLRWLIDKPCKSIVADGGLHLFKEENAPEGAPLKCTDGCPHEATCPYSAIDIYTRKKAHLYVFDLHGKNDTESIMAKLKDPAYDNYARCVYHCDNDQPDHYVSDMVFEDGVTAAFSMEAFSPWGGRRTRIMGTTGYLEGDGSKFTVTDFRTRKQQVWDKKISDIPEYKDAGHGGGDLALARDFVEAVAHQDPSRLSSTIDVSIESHVMGFAAERSRKTGKKEKVKV